MKNKILAGAAVAAALVLAGGAAVSYAQPAPPPDAPGMARPDPAAMAQRRAERLRDVLQLRPDQEPALRAFTEAMRPPEGLRERMMERRQEMRELSTPERLDRMKAHMAERQAAFDRRAAAIKRFYAALTPAQQKAFDAMRPMGRGGMRPMRMHGGMGPMGPGPKGPEAPPHAH